VSDWQQPCKINRTPQVAINSHAPASAMLASDDAALFLFAAVPKVSNETQILIGY
jgi:hypothetical protein